MRKLLFILLLFPFTNIAQLSVEQQAEVDSLKQVIKTAKHDSILVNTWIAWDNIIYMTDPELDFTLNLKIDSLCTINLFRKLGKQEKFVFLKAKSNAVNVIGIVYYNQGDYVKAIEYYTKSLKIKEELEDKLGMAATFNNIGMVYYDQGNYARAINYYTKSLKIQKELGDKLGTANSYNSIGTIYADEGDYAQAIEYHTKSLKIKEEIGDKIGIAMSFNNIGNIYHHQGDDRKALEYYTKSLKIKEEIADKLGMAMSYNSIGVIYHNQGDYVKALDFCTKGLKIKEELGAIKVMTTSLVSIATIYKSQGDYAKALVYYSKSLKIVEEIGNKKGITYSLSGIGGIYYEQGNYAKAKNYSLRALTIAQEIGAPKEVTEASIALSKIYKKLGNYKESLAMYELYITSRDSILSKENQKELIRQEYKYNYEKQTDSIAIEQSKKDELSLAEEKRKEDLANKENEKKNLIIGSGAGGLGLTLIFTFVVINRLRITRKQKSIIEQQKTAVEQQKTIVEIAHTEITDSINYAKRLQDAILPSLAEVNNHLPNTFILFKPKAAVSGDFYWFEEVNGTAYLAAADCTGHGVPGAMVSLVCSNALNRVVKEFGITEPAKILDKTRELVIETFAKSKEEVKDGMDIALCAFKENKVTYSGANNPLWIVRKTDLITEDQKQERSTIIQNESSIIEYKSNKQPIGLYAGMKAFTQQEIELYSGDCLYFFTDGFADQFGGEKGKKFKYKPFKRLLIEMHIQPMTDQAQLIFDTFENWKGDIEQVDDVCVIGIKI